MSVQGTLKGHDLFRSLTPNEANLINSFSSTKKFGASEIIFRYNDLADHVYMLIRGSVHLQLPASPEDISFVISNMEKGELFGLSPLLDSPRYTATAVCNEDSEVLSIESKPFRELLRSNCQVGISVMNQVAHIYFHRYVNVLTNLQNVANQISLIR